MKTKTQYSNAEYPDEYYEEKEKQLSDYEKCVCYEHENVMERLYKNDMTIIKDAIKYGFDHVTLNENEIGPEVYQELILEKITQYLDEWVDGKSK